MLSLSKHRSRKLPFDKLRANGAVGLTVLNGAHGLELRDQRIDVFNLFTGLADGWF